MSRDMAEIVNDPSKSFPERQMLLLYAISLELSKINSAIELITGGINELGNPEDEPNLNLAQYLEALEYRITNIESRLERNFHILTP